MVDWVEWEDRQADEYRMRRGYGGVRGERDRMGEGGGRYRPSESTPRYRRRGDSIPPPPGRPPQRGYPDPESRRRAMDIHEHYTSTGEVVFVDEGDYDGYYDYDDELEYQRSGKDGPWDFEEMPPSYQTRGSGGPAEPMITRTYEYKRRGDGRDDDRYPPDDEGRYGGFAGRSFWDQMGFYNFFWDPRYNIKIPVMQIVAIVSLVIIFILNYNINYEFVKLLGDFSVYVAIQPPELAWVFALMLALFLSVVPSMEREYRLQITLWIIIIIILGFIFSPAITFFATYDMMEVGRALANSLIAFLKVMAVLLYWSPILLAVYGIFNRERMYVFAAVLFFLGVIIFTDIYMMGYGIPHDKDASKIPLFSVFALALFCFYEMSDSSITFFNMNESPLTWDRQSAHQMHLDRILQKYFVFFIIFSALALVLTVPILSFNDVLSALGSEQVGASVELNSIYGIVVSLFVIIVFLIFIGYLIRYENDIINKLKKVFGSIVPAGPVARRERRERPVFDEDLDIPPPPTDY